MAYLCSRYSLLRTTALKESLQECNQADINPYFLHSIFCHGLKTTLFQYANKYMRSSIMGNGLFSNTQLVFVPWDVRMKTFFAGRPVYSVALLMLYYARKTFLWHSERMFSLAFIVFIDQVFYVLFVLRKVIKNLT